MTKENSPVIRLPADPNRVEQLRAKLDEYEERIDRFLPPEVQMEALSKMEVLKALLERGEIDTWEISREMARKYGDTWSPSAFNNACAVIDDYCKTGGINTSGGTGLSSKQN